MSDTHPMYVCNECGYARYHRLNYCPKCPGKMRLEKKDITHPPASGALGGTNWTELGGQAAWLKKNAGVDYRDYEDSEKAEMRGKLQRAEKLIAREITPVRRVLTKAKAVTAIYRSTNDPAALIYALEELSDAAKDMEKA
jgi:hypothetical protein